MVDMVCASGVSRRTVVDATDNGCRKLVSLMIQLK